MVRSKNVHAADRAIFGSTYKSNLLYFYLIPWAPSHLVAETHTDPSMVFQNWNTCGYGFRSPTSALVLCLMLPMQIVSKGSRQGCSGCKSSWERDWGCGYGENCRSLWVCHWSWRSECACNCCMQCVLFLQPDFVNEKPLLQLVIEKAGHKCLFLPKVHCKLNLIEMVWGQMKWSKSLRPNVITQLLTAFQDFVSLPMALSLMQRSLYLSPWIMSLVYAPIHWVVIWHGR